MGYIGFDIGGSNVRFAFTDKLGLNKLECQKRSFVKTGNPHTEVEKNICGIIDEIPDAVEGIGISLAAVMDRNTGKVTTWPNNPCWNHYDLVHHLSGKYNVPITIEDDANCGAIGEYYHMNTTVKNIAYITIGTGIGCGLILNHSLFIGENGFAGELGHVYIGKGKDKNICSCGNEGCFQSVVSGPSVLKEYNTLTKVSLESLEQVYEQYVLSDQIAVQCLSNMISNIAKVIYNLAMCLNISVFVIGGGASNMGAEFISQIESRVNECLSHFEREVLIRQAQLGEFSGVYGALQLLKSRICIEKG